MNKKYKKLILISAILSVTAISTSVFAMSGRVTTKTNNAKKSQGVVIYNSHYDEKYSDGNTVVTVAQELNKLLIKDEIDSIYLKNKKTVDYIKSYDNSRELITKNIKDCDNKILIDIHREIGNKNAKSNKTIRFDLTSENPNYKEQKKFIDSLVKKLKENKNLSVGTFTLKKGTRFFNQDLSKKAITVEVGNECSSKKDIQECISSLSDALKGL